MSAAGGGPVTAAGDDAVTPEADSAVTTGHLYLRRALHRLVSFLIAVAVLTSVAAGAANV